VNGLALILAKMTLAAAMLRMGMAVAQHSDLLAGAATSSARLAHRSRNRRKLLRD